jgi:hypothetical protein
MMMMMITAWKQMEKLSMTIGAMIATPPKFGSSWCTTDWLWSAGRVCREDYARRSALHAPNPLLSFAC